MDKNTTEKMNAELDAIKTGFQNWTAQGTTRPMSWTGGRTVKALIARGLVTATIERTVDIQAGRKTVYVTETAFITAVA